MTNYSTLVDVLIENEMKGISNHERIIEIGNTPDLLLHEAGFPPLKMAIKAKTISKICFDHGVKKSLIKTIPCLLENPKCIYRSANAHMIDSAVVLTFETKGTAPIIIAVRKNMQAGRETYNFVTSMYGKEGPDIQNKWKNLLIYKKRS